jgi:predicted helicase
VPWQAVTPNAAGDWVNQRSQLFETFPPLGDKRRENRQAIFGTYSLGVATGRDAWTYSFSRDRLLEHMGSTIAFYETEKERVAALVRLGQLTGSAEAVEAVLDTDPTRISWTRAVKGDLRRQRPAHLDTDRAVLSLYRPFCKRWLYFDRQWNEMVYQVPRLFPTRLHPNRVIAVSARGGRLPFSALMVDAVPDLCVADAAHGSQCFPRYRYVETDEGSLFSAGGGFERHDAISDGTLDAYRTRFGGEVSADDVFYYVYGVLHSPEYRTRFAADLGKMIPRLPMLDAFFEFSEAGRRLAELHVGYESVEPWPLEGLPGPSANPSELRVEKMRFGGNARKPDRSSVVVNPHITLSGIPDEAHDYAVNGRTALEWILDRYRVKVDKASGIRNDPNDWSEDPRYIVDLVARIVRVSVESAAVIASLPSLGI